MTEHAIGVTNDDFLSAIFGPYDPTAEARPLVCSLTGSPEGRKGWPARPWVAGSVGNPETNLYFCPALYRPKDDRYRALKSYAASIHCFMLDDIGTKVPMTRLDACAPTWLIETSPGNFQAGYVLSEPLTDIAHADSIKDALVSAGLCDAGATGAAARWMRLPQAINGKPQHIQADGSPWRCRLTVWQPDRRYTPDQLIDALELEPPAAAPAPARKRASPARAAELIDQNADDVHRPRAAENPVIRALREKGLYKGALGDGKHDVTCLAVHEHTNGIDHGTVYFEPSDLYPVGGFRCQHSHGDKLKIGALLAHLGLSFHDAKHRATIRIQAGELHRIADAAERELANTGRFYQRGGLIVQVSTAPETGETGIKPLSLSALSRALSAAAIWQRYDARSECFLPCDPPMRHVSAVHDAAEYAHLPALAGLARQPYLRHDGSICRASGYDRATGLFGVFRESDFSIPAKPDRAAAEKALSLLLGLLREFSFAAPHDKAAALSAILTAAIRPSLEAAPMFHVRAPQPGSGKSYLVGVISAFASPSRPSAAAWPTTEEEASKLLLALLLEGPAAINFDNLTADLAPLRTICSALTETFIVGRVLGFSKTATVSTRALFLSSGNNVRPVADMARRCITITIDPRVENPAARRFDGDPLAALRERRGEYVSAALTVVRAYLECGSRVQCRPLAGFEQWSAWAREPLLWLGMADPAAAVFEQIEADPDREQLGRVLTAWHQAFGSAPTMVRDAVRAAESAGYGRTSELKEALLEVAEVRGEINRRSLGRWIARHQNRLVDGLRFERAEGRTSAERWIVKSVMSVKSVSASAASESVTKPNARGDALPWQSAADDYRAATRGY